VMAYLETSGERGDGLRDGHGGFKQAREY
jgi:hypothetical protein